MADNEYFRKYYENHKEKCLDSMRRYSKEHRTELSLKHKKYVEEHRDQINENRRRNYRLKKIVYLEEVIPDLQQTIRINYEECDMILYALSEHSADKSILVSEHNEAVKKLHKNIVSLQKKQEELHRLKQEMSL